MGTPGRKPRPEPVIKTAAYLTENALNAVNNIRHKLPLCRPIRISTNSDALELAALEFSKTLDQEYSAKIKNATGRPMMGGTR